MPELSATAVRTYTVSLGCPKNRVDTERLLGALGSHMVPVDEFDDADLILINTCGFIQPATEESVATILDAVRDAAELFETTGRKPLVCVAGCLVSRYGQDLKDDLPEVDLWLNTEEIELWPAMAARALALNLPGDTPRNLSTGPAYAYLKVSEGCSHNCRFCTIPSIRGPHKSWPVPFLLDEARLLSSQVPEIIVVGQDSTAYGSDLGPGHDLPALLKGLASIPTIEWLRIMYLYPAGLTESLLGLLRDTGKPFLPYFDIPLQHAHPDVLASMGRPLCPQPGEGHRPGPVLLPGGRPAHHLHRGLSRRDRGAVPGAHGFCPTHPVSPSGRVPLLGRGRHPCRGHGQPGPGRGQDRPPRRAHGVAGRDQRRDHGRVCGGDRAGAHREGVRGMARPVCGAGVVPGPGGGWGYVCWLAAGCSLRVGEYRGG